MFLIRKFINAGLLWGLVCGISASAQGALELGPLYHSSALTLYPGWREEILGPLFSLQKKEEDYTWAFSPLLSETQYRATDAVEFDFLYPLVTYDRFGHEYRFQIIQLFSFSGGQAQDGPLKKRFTLFPFYFQQRSTEPDLNYTAVLPFYGTLKNRLFRDEVHFVMLPLYVETRKKDVVTDNYLLPFFHLRHGIGLKGWQFWPLVGREHKDVTTSTNSFGDAVTSPGHDSFFAVWPFFTTDTSGIGTDNPDKKFALLPFYASERSPQRDSTSYLWPFGPTITDDRARKYHEVDAPWPFIVFAHGEGKTIHRVWPFFSHGHNDKLVDNFYLWPVYKYYRLRSEPLDRQRTRILFFAYSDTIEINSVNGDARRRTDVWPFYSHHSDFDGKDRKQFLALLEPFFPGNKGIERNYSPLWSLWRSEKNPNTGASSQSLFWNLYRHDKTPTTRKTSFFFGLFQSQSGPEGHRVRILFIPFGKKSTNTSTSATSVDKNQQ